MMSKYSSLTGLVLAAACSATAPAKQSTPAASPKGESYTTISSASVPKFFPNFVTPCKSDRMDTIMKDAFNPSLTMMADALYRGGDDRMQEVADAAAVVLGCTQNITSHRNSRIPEDQWPVFDHFMIQLVMNTQALQTAALEDEPEDVKHWFHHVKQSCAACHARFNSR